MITLGRSEQMGPCACAYDLAHVLIYLAINALGTMFYSFWVSQLNRHLHVDPLTHVFKHTFYIIDTARLPTDCPYIPLLSLYTRLRAEGNLILGPSFKVNWLLFSVLHRGRARQRQREKQQKGDMESNQFPRGFFNSRRSFHTSQLEPFLIREIPLHYWDGDNDTPQHFRLLQNSVDCSTGTQRIKHWAVWQGVTLVLKSHVEIFWLSSWPPKTDGEQWQPGTASVMAQYKKMILAPNGHKKKEKEPGEREEDWGMEGRGRGGPGER